jgi:hypothetical protein
MCLTFTLPNELSSIEYKHTSCIANAELWLLIHLIIKIAIEIVFYNVFLVVPFLFICIVMCPHEWRRLSTYIFDYSWLHTSTEREGYWYFTILKQEMMLIFGYVFISYVSTLNCSKNLNGIITGMMLLRWSIEGSNVPIVFFYTIFMPYTEFLNSFSNYYQLIYISAILYKLPLFALMRISEQETDFILNAMHQFLFNKLCFSSTK